MLGLISEQMTIDTWTHGILIWSNLILLSIQENLIDVIIVEIVYITNVRCLDYGNWLMGWLLELLIVMLGPA